MEEARAVDRTAMVAKCMMADVVVMMMLVGLWVELAVYKLGWASKSHTCG